jgi:hypothetical protein
MYSDAVSQAVIETKIIETNGNGFHKSAEVYEKWKDWHASEISHHGGMCCEIAREWITSTDFSERGGASIYTGPRWLRQKFYWGASSFPIFWCEAVRKKTLDCGALAALAAEIFIARGVKTFRVQMVQRYSEASTSQWSNSWNDTDEQLRWMNDDLIYHEGCAIVTGDGEIKIWDASAGWWVDPRSKDGYGALLAIRLSAFNLPADITFTWGQHHFNALQWTKVN